MEIKNPLNENALFLDLTTRVWSGEKAIHRDADLSLVANQLPPKDLMRDGVKQIVPGAFLAEIRNIAAKAERAAALQGVRILKGWAVPTELAEATHKALQGIQREWNDQVDYLVGELPTAYATQQAAYPTWASMLKDAQMSPAQVRSSFSFSWTWLEIAAPRNHAPALGEGYASLGAQAFESLLKDIATPAARLLVTASRKDQVTQATLNATRRLVSKLSNFAFLDPKIGPAVDAINGTLIGIPDGRLDPTSTFALRAVLSALRDPDQLWSYASLPEAAPPQKALQLAGGMLPLNF
ncbi:hypothetical protein C7S18_23985 (plasmid) [Ahniella affigens]|uniref:DUF3150 domain-containing protein n=1 Tax=Ahniella affigens TaxID=2021234 RepID=A0A2P1PZU0_9GAMM|nr:DUF3150 domain-containing protein [Ahniella affigens]AVQ00362.1 hypothetical protein C7S18_23985 [Ahniella affigens]